MRGTMPGTRTIEPELGDHALEHAATIEASGGSVPYRGSHVILEGPVLLKAAVGAVRAGARAESIATMMKSGWHFNGGVFI